MYYYFINNKKKVDQENTKYCNSTYVLLVYKHWILFIMLIFPWICKHVSSNKNIYIEG